MKLAELIQELTLELKHTDDAALGRLAKKYNPVTQQSELADLIGLINQLTERDLSKFEKTMSRVRDRGLDVDHPQIIAAKEIKATIDQMLESDDIGQDAIDNLMNQIAQFNAAKKGLHGPQVKAIYV